MYQNKIHAVHQARAWLKAKPLYLDTETTGLGSSNEIVDLALIDHNGTALINTLIRPTTPISAKASQIHGISNKDIVDAPGFNEIIVNLVALTKNHQVLIYNAAFDQRLLRQSATAHKITLKNVNVMSKVNCVMLVYAQFHGEWNSNHHSYTWQSQETAAHQLDLEVPANLHRAAADARLCRQIVLAMATTKLPGEEPTK